MIQLKLVPEIDGACYGCEYDYQTKWSSYGACPKSDVWNGQKSQPEEQLLCKQYGGGIWKKIDDANPQTTINREEAERAINEALGSFRGVESISNDLKRKLESLSNNIEEIRVMVK